MIYRHSNMPYDNSVTAFTPQYWANESIALLLENMVAVNLVHRDFEPIVANMGDTVNTRKPADLVAYRKTNADNVTVQDVSATNVAVKLDQHLHTSFLIKDGEESKAMKSLVEEYLRPAMISQARFLDKVVLGQWAQFYGYSGGRLGNLSGNVVSSIVDTRRQLNINKVPEQDRNLIWTPNSEAEALKTADFVNAEKSGDAGTALRTASLGNLFGFNNFMCQNMSSIGTNMDTVTGAVNNAAGYAAGVTTMTVDGLSAAITAGTFFKVAGDDTPHRVVSTTGGSTPTAIVFTPALKRAVVDNAVITIYDPGAVNNSGGYAADYAKTIAFDGMTNGVQVGAMVSFGSSSTTALYTVVDATSTTITLDRPLEAAIADDATLNVCPAGEYNFAFQKNAIALVTRPLALPKQGTGALSAVANFNGLSIRAVITYDGNKQGHLVTLDMLFGVKVLDPLLGAVMFG